MIRAKTIAWIIHGYTASGAVFGVLALIATAQNDIQGAFFYLLIAACIDATDGLLARRFKVSEVLPNFSRAYVDNAVDVLTFIFAPIFIIAWVGLLPHILWIAVPTLAGMYAYGQVDMKTDDHYFLGFPSYWNIVAVYLWWLDLSPTLTVIAIVIPAVLTFVPTRWLYPSRNTVLWKTTWALGIPWLLMLGWLLFQDEPERKWILISLYYPAYYVLASFYIDIRIRMGTKAATLEGEASPE